MSLRWPCRPSANESTPALTENSRVLRLNHSEMERLGDSLRKYIDGIAAYCDQHVRFGVVEVCNSLPLLGGAAWAGFNGGRLTGVPVPRPRWVLRAAGQTTLIFGLLGGQRRVLFTVRACHGG